VILKFEIYNFHRLDLTRQAGFIVTVYDEDGLKLALRTHAQPLPRRLWKREKSSITKSRVQERNKLRRAEYTTLPNRGEYERRDDYRFRSRGNNPVAVAEMAAR
jgi:hypothetical protein